MASSVSSTAPSDVRDSPKIDIPASATIGDSVRRGTVAARIRAFQEQQVDAVEPSQTPAVRKTPKRLDLGALKFLESSQPLLQTSPTSPTKLTSDPSKQRSDLVQSSLQTSPQRSSTTPQETVKATPGSALLAEPVEDCDLGDHYNAASGAVSWTRNAAANGRLERDVREMWKRSTEDNSDSGGGSSQATATQEDTVKADSLPERNATRQSSWPESSMVPTYCADEHKEDYSTIPPRPFLPRQPPVPVQAPQPLTPTQASFLTDKPLSDDICWDDEQSEDLDGLQSKDKQPGKGADGNQEPREKNKHSKQETLRLNADCHHQDSPTTKIRRPKRSHRARIESQTYTELPDTRFDVFVRERTGESSVSSTADPIITEAPVTTKHSNALTRSSHASTEPSSQPEQPKASRGWRWWKLVLNERETGPESSGATESTLDNSGQRKVSMRKPRGSESGSSADSGCMQIDQAARLDSLIPTQAGDQSRRASFQPADLHGIPDTVFSQKPATELNGLRVHDAFGNSVLIDDQELPTEALEKLSSIESPGKAAETSRRSYRNQRHTPKDHHRRTDKIQVPLEAIAPIIQNDGTSSHWGQIPQNNTKPPDSLRNTSIARSMVQEMTADTPARPSEETPVDGCKIALNNQGRRTTVDVAEEEDADGRGKKIVVTVEDDIKKLLRVEIFPGKSGTAVVQRGQ